MKKGIYIIRDTLADQVIGQLLMFPHDAAAVRFFGDICSDDKTSVARHVTDHELWCIGHIDEDQARITPTEGAVRVITGAAWAAAQQTRGDA